MVISMINHVADVAPKAPARSGEHPSLEQIIRAASSDLAPRRRYSSGQILQFHELGEPCTYLKQK